MAEARLTFETQRSVSDCATTFRSAVSASYGGARKLLRAVATVRDGGADGVEFFTPPTARGANPDWQSGALVPGFSKMHGASRVGVHVYVTDLGSTREVQLVGPYSMGDKGSTERLLRNIADRF